MSDDVEARLRNALSARAQQVTPDLLRPAEPPAEPTANGTRTRRRRPSRTPARAGRKPVRSAIPLAVAAATLVVIMLGSFLHEGPDGHTKPSHQAGTATPGAATHATLDGAAFRVPPGWIYRSVAEGVGCLQLADTPQPAGECVPVGVEVRVGNFVGWPKNTLDSDDGWSLSQTCATSTGLASHLSVVSNRVVERGSRQLGGSTAEYRVWQVRCDMDVSFTVRLWWWPEEAVTVYTLALDSRHDTTVDQIVGGMDVSGLREKRSGQ